jgi:DNA-binding winged helix-turn-helix (wHTH) protein
MGYHAAHNLQGGVPMASSGTQPGTIRFGPFELDLTNRELRKRGNIVKLQPQQFAVLVLLVEHAGQIVSRDEIHQQIWGDDTFVDFERGINFAINQVRAALGDDAEKPRYVETIPRRGYRFICPIQVTEATPVEPEANASKENPIASASADLPAAETEQRSKGMQKWLLMGLGFAMLVIAGLFISRHYSLRLHLPGSQKREPFQVAHNCSDKCPWPCL